MPSTKLPHTPKGWFVALVASLVGLLSGFITVNFLNRILGP